MNNSIDHILMTFCTGSHWILIVLYDLKIMIYDSYANDYMPLVSKIKNWLLNQTGKNWEEIYMFRNKVQFDSWSCGVWVCKCADLVCSGEKNLDRTQLLWEPITEFKVVILRSLLKHQKQIRSRAVYDICFTLPNSSNTISV